MPLIHNGYWEGCRGNSEPRGGLPRFSTDGASPAPDQGTARRCVQVAAMRLDVSRDPVRGAVTTSD